MIKELITRKMLQPQKLLLVLGMMAISIIGHSQTYSTTELCTCLNNQDYNIGMEGQFTSTVNVSTITGQNWWISNPDGIFLPNPADPLNPIPVPNNYVVAEDGAGSGMYPFQFLHLNDALFSFTITDGTNFRDYSYSSDFPACRYAHAIISGEEYVCKGESARYSVLDEENASFSWSISGGGVITSTVTTNPLIEVDWGNVPGTYEVEVVASLPALGCDETNTFTVVVEDVISLACNNSVNLSMNNDCEINIVPSMILENMEYEDDSYRIVITDTETDLEVTNGVLGHDYIGKTLQVQIYQKCGSNSCWGYVHIEDKSVSDIVCPPDITINCEELTSASVTGLPITPSFTPVLQSDGTYLLAGYDNCGDAYLSYVDVSNPTDCTAATSSVITRTWTVTDEFGSTKTCSQDISIERATLADITFPGNWDDLSGPNPTLEACGNELLLTDPMHWIALENGYPSPETTGYPLGANCLNIHMFYIDEEYPICGDHAYKLQRTWTVREECTGEIETRIQLITVMDRRGPVVISHADTTQTTSNYSCSAIIDVIPPQVIFECSEWDYTVGYKTRDTNVANYADVIYEGVDRDPITGLYTIDPVIEVADSMWIVRFITDECGNQTVSRYEIAFEDNVNPTPVCDIYSYVALNDVGVAFAGVETFDDGSWDNCGIDRMTVRRMNSNGCFQPSGGELVKFCCNDVGTTQMVQLTVYDAANNSNSCMVEVEIQDNDAPEITCPADITIDCTSQITNLNAYGIATAEDVCSAVVTQTHTSELDGCGKGTIIRTFTATDRSNNTSTCTQVITISNLDPFYINSNNPNDSTDDIVWPEDVTIDGCGNTNIEPEDLPLASSFPVLSASNCSSTAVNHKDVVFQFVEEACYKVLRTWTVIDWCQFNPYAPGSTGEWSYTQVIKIHNNTAPVITSGCQDSDVITNSLTSCGANITINATGTDDCSAPQELTWSYTLDEYNDGSIQSSGTKATVTRTMGYGTHKICWTVADDCGNYTECCNTFTIEDNKAPTPYCLDAIVSVINPVDGKVTIWASDFDNGATDNCDTNLEISFTPDVDDKFRTFTCGDIPNGISDTILVNIYYTDASGNQDFCTSKFIVQDNHDMCPDQVVPQAKVSIAGSVYTEDDKMVNNVSMMLMNESVNLPQYQMTSEQGGYAFNELNMYGDFMLEPTKDIDYMNGVSTLDLVIIQKHILGVQNLDSPFKMIAADINSSESISAIDLIELRKLILGIYDELPNNKSYRFVDASSDLNSASSPFPFVENKNLTHVEKDMMDNDFIAVKVGDVNGSATYSFNNEESIENRNNHVVNLMVDNKDFENEEIVTIDFRMDQAIFTPGFQLSLDVNDEVLELIDIESKILNINDHNIAYNHNAWGDDKLAISWNDVSAHNIETDEVLFTASFRALRNGSLSKEQLISIDEASFNSEIYSEENNGYGINNIRLILGNTKADAIDFKLYQNVPNPFDQSTRIGFELPSDEFVTLRIFDTTGKVIYSIAENYPSGYNEILIQTKAIKQKGILYYQLETNSHIASKKMIVID